MNGRTYDVVVAKEYETYKDGQLVKRTAWNRVGRAWKSRDSEALNFELFLIPNQRYVIPLREVHASPSVQTEATQP